MWCWHAGYMLETLAKAQPDAVAAELSTHYVMLPCMGDYAMLACRLHPEDTCGGTAGSSGSRVFVSGGVPRVAQPEGGGGAHDADTQSGTGGEGRVRCARPLAAAAAAAHGR